MFGGSDDTAGSSSGDKLSINRSFARRYEAHKDKEDMQHLKRRGVGQRGEEEESEESTSESEDEEGRLLTDDVDLSILATIEKIRRKDPSIYDAGKSFAVDAVGAAAEEEAAGGGKKKKKKPLMYKDYLREQVMEAMDAGGDDATARILQDEDEEEEGGGAQRRRLAAEEPVSSYDAEQQALKQAFLTSVDKADGGDDEEEEEEGSDDDSDGGGLFKKREKTDAEKAADARDQATAAARAKISVPEQESLKRYFSEQLQDPDAREHQHLPRRVNF